VLILIPLSLVRTPSLNLEPTLNTPWPYFKVHNYFCK
jgi:hypothetical protein